MDRSQRQTVLEPQRGNLAVLAAIMISAITLVMGGSLDVVRATTLRVSMQQALDAAVLAASPLNQTQDANEAVRQYFFANISDLVANPEAVDLVISSDLNDSGKSVSASASVSYPTVFLPLIGIAEMTIDVESGGEQGWQQVEVSLVVDVSGSMGGSKIAELRAAAEEFVELILTDDVIDLTTISLIPFATHVNVGSVFEDYLDPASIDNDKDNDYTDGHRWLGCIDMKADHHSIDAFEDGDITPLPEYENYRLCPDDDNQAIFVSNNKSDLISRIRDLENESCPACYTGIDEGAALGLKALVPDMRGAFGGGIAAGRPLDTAPGNVKVLVVMTDGAMNKYYRPTHCWDYTYGCSEYPITEADAEQSLRNMCSAARAEGMIVFAVGFQIPVGSSADTLMRDCASDDLHYFLAGNNELEDVFAQIAGYIQAVRLIG